MATASIFMLITNDGKQDKMLMATEALHQRLCAIKNVRAQKEGMDASPTLHDIERTHLLFTNSHFRPFCATAFEYNSQASNAGSSTLGSSIQFNIPQFGDFFSDMALHLVLQGPASSSYVTAGTAASDRPLIRWAEYLGERVLQSVAFTVNGNPLDDYTREEVNAHRELFVPPWKLSAWKRCMAQEEVVAGHLAQPNWAASGYDDTEVAYRVASGVYNGLQTPHCAATPDTVEMFIPIDLWFCKSVDQAVASVAIPQGQRFLTIQLAPQSDVIGLVPRGAGTNAAPNGSLSSSAVAVKTCELYINNIFVNPEIHDIYIKRIGFTLIRVHRRQTQQITQSQTQFQLQQLKWPIEYLVVGMKLFNLYQSSDANDMALQLSDWHRFAAPFVGKYDVQGTGNFRLNAVVDSSDHALTVSSTSLASTTSLIQFVLSANPVATGSGALAAGSVLVVNGQHYTVANVSTATVTTAQVGATAAPVVAAGTPAYVVGPALAAGGRPRAGQTVVTHENVPLLGNLTVTAHGINLYDNFEFGFHNSYLPLRFGKGLNAPDKNGLAFVPFCFNPGEYQPSGHINVSRAREFYITLNSAIVGAAGSLNNATTTDALAANGLGSVTVGGTPQGQAFIMASCLNFLLISDGSCVLRFST